MSGGRTPTKDGRGTTTKCLHCGKSFVRKHKGQAYCCRSCGTKSPKRTDKQNHKLRQQPDRGVCKTCGKSLNGVKHRRTYCSDACYKAAKKNDWQKEKNLNKHSFTCPICGQMFRSSHKDRKYCSVECKGKGMRRTMEGRNVKPVGMEQNRGETILVVVTAELPVNREMRPRMGKVYAAVRYWDGLAETVVVPEFGKYGTILRKGEYRVVKG